MFKKSNNGTKKKEIQNTVVSNKNGQTTVVHTTFTQEVRSEKVTKSVVYEETRSSLLSNTNFSQSSLFDKPRNSLLDKPRISLLDRDANPFVSNNTYKSSYQSPYFQRPNVVRPITNTTPSPVLGITKTLNTTSIKDNKIPTYDTKGKKRGKVLIVNNINFINKTLQTRNGAQNDDKALQSTFKKIGFTVNVERNLTQAKMKQTIQKFANDRSLKDCNITMLVVMSHGTNMNVKGGCTEICGIDEKSINVEDIVSYFRSIDCPHLSGKPKIFIFQCCRGEMETIMETDAVLRTNRDQDCLIAFSTIPGFVSYRNPVDGSHYIQYLCEMVQLYAEEWDIETILKKVEEKLGKATKQTSCYECRGFKRCYLYQK